MQQDGAHPLGPAVWPALDVNMGHSPGAVPAGHCQLLQLCHTAGVWQILHQNLRGQEATS